MKEGLIGGVVIIAVILAAIIGVMLVSDQPYGRAFQTQQECSCAQNGYRMSVFYADEYVLLPDGSVRSVGPLDDNIDTCMQVCARIGAHA